MSQRTLSPTSVVSVRLIDHRALLLTTLICLLTLFPRETQGATPQLSAPPPAVAVATKIDAFLSTLQRDKVFMGTVLVARRGSLLVQKGYGYADSDQRIVNTPQTVYRSLYGIDRLVLAVAILQLQDEHRLHIQDHICRYLNACPAAWTTITIQQLLIGTSGLYNYLTTESAVGVHTTIPALVALIARHPLAFQPGTRCCTASASQPVLQDIVEHIAGESYGQFLQQHQFAPLGLTHIGYYGHLPPPGHYAIGYFDLAQVLLSKAVDMSYIGGTVYASATDLYRWVAALMSGKLLSPPSLAALLQVQYLFCPPDCATGQTAGAVSYGGISETWEGHRRLWVAGELARHGIVNNVLIYPTDHVIVVILSNLGIDEPVLYSTITSTLHHIIFGASNPTS